jgi:hypothetical protein
MADSQLYLSQNLRLVWPSQHAFSFQSRYKANFAIARPPMIANLYDHTDRINDAYPLPGYSRVQNSLRRRLIR